MDNSVFARSLPLLAPGPVCGPTQLVPHDSAPSKPDPFSESWWWDAATRGRYDMIEVRRDGNMRLALPVYKLKKHGLMTIAMPPYTRTLRPDLTLPPSGPFKRRRNIRMLVGELVERLPQYDNLRLLLDPEDETPFGFSLAGLQIRQKFTFRLAAGFSLDRTLRDCDQKSRNLIRSAGRRLEVTQDIGLSNFIALSRVERGASGNTHQFTVLERIFEQCARRGQGTTLSAWDGRKCVASVIMVWGSHTAYFWQSTRDRQSGICGANLLLLWKCIEIAHARNLIFDFDSYHSVETAKMVSSFGCPPIARPEINGRSLAWHVATTSKAIARRALSRDLDWHAW
ncbi:GNAT family N-acetyltransferase [Acetobacter sp. TBRC 12305]|uniref:GNAT family N-acetyltransferase n=1 Tax=Acetobacter garciniae TaxID=2817435 RepID=A0A939KQA8_9PROT|nr:GNAT family N-acetyltransferase [Acetobacter garciniae]MBO1325134.1 GNAT family N-acetyltransferase [Acetobacter garciniae]MBX0344895.1 GNAT family N-acetyltransferase [Acetobacter garciniae]